MFRLGCGCLLADVRVSELSVLTTIGRLACLALHYKLMINKLGR